MQQRQRLGLLYAVTFGYFGVSSLFLVGIPLYVTANGGNAGDVGLAVGVFFAVAIVLRPGFGRMSDRIGRRPFMLMSLAVLAVSALGVDQVDTVPSIIAMRMFQGVSGSAFYTTAAAMATDLADPERRASAVARFSTALYAGFALGPVAGEQLIRQVGFHRTWLGSGAVALVALALAFALPETAAGVGVRREPTATRRSRFPLHRASWGPGLVLAGTGTGYVGITGFSALYAEAIDLGSSRLLYLTFAVTILSIRLVLGRVADRFSHVQVALPGLALATVGMAVLAGVGNAVGAVAGVALFAIGFALVFPSLLTMTVDRVPADERAHAVGSYTAFMDIGQGGGGVVLGRVVKAVSATSGPLAGYRRAYELCAVLIGCGFVGLVVMARRSRDLTGPDLDDTVEVPA